MRLKNPFKDLNRFEILLYISSLLLILLSFLLTRDKDYLSLTASLIGATALIFVAKGYVLGQVLTVVFSIFYGIISFHFRYYGEMLTYLCMTAPIALASVISWIKNPFEDTKEVKVNKLSNKLKILLVITAPLVTLIFYFILKYFGTANLFFSTVSVTTSFVACYLTFFRSPFYAIGYSANDIVLIILWILAAIEKPSCLPMILCFVTFLLNDLYGFYNWKQMEKRQKK